MLSLVPLNDVSELAEALTAAKLPAGDIAEKDRRFYRAVDAEGIVIGYGGFEGSGADQLLRSVVVLTQWRGDGRGRALVEALLTQAGQDGATRTWLLTTDAADFFRHLGFADAARDAAPAVVTTSLQFTTLCSASAKVLVKTL